MSASSGWIPPARLLRLVFLAAAILAPAPYASPQTQPRTAPVQVIHDVWGFKDGAPQRVQAIAQTTDGFLWLGSASGLYRFDGARFESFEPVAGEQLLSNSVYALLAPKSGGLWVGYSSGAFSFVNKGRVQNFAQDKYTGRVLEFAQDQAGVVWAVTQTRLWRFDGSHWQSVGVEWNAPTTRIGHAGFDRTGNLWVIDAAEGLFRLAPGGKRFEIVAKSVPAEFTVDADHYVVTHELRSPGLGSGQLLPYPVLGRAGRDEAGIIDRANNIWVASPQPVITRMPAADWLSGGTLDDSPCANVETYSINPWWYAKLVDREGNVWFVDLKAIHRLLYSPIVKQQLPVDAPMRSSSVVAAGEEGSTWIAMGDNEPDGRVYHVTADQVEVLGPVRNPSMFAYRAPDKTVWFSGYRALTHLVGHALLKVELPPSLADHYSLLQTITQDRQGGLWVSFGILGLYRMANGVWTPNGGRTDLPGIDAGGVLIEFTDESGRIWFGYPRDTLAVLDNDHVAVFGAQDGVSVGSVTAIQGRGSEVWIGGELGLQLFDQGHFGTIKAVNSEWLKGITGIVQTRSGDLWLYGLAGIFHIPRAEILRARKDPTYQVTGEHFGRRQGVPGVPLQTRSLPSAIEGSDGRLWYVGGDGVAWVDPAQAKNQAVPPSVTIQALSADGRFYSPREVVDLPAHTSDVQFTYSAVSLSDPDAIRYRYKLNETERDWHESRFASPVTYRNLSPGSYHFTVMATDVNGVWSDKTATAKFTITPAFYQTRWFYALCALIFAGLLWMLYQLRLQQLRRAFNMTLEARVGERTRIARELHDTLLQNFQGVLLRLRTVQTLIAKRPAQAEETLESAITEARVAITEGRSAVQGLRSSAFETSDFTEAIRTLGEALASDPAYSGSVALNLNIKGTPRVLQPLVRDEIYRTASEALRNAYRHADASRIEVQLDYGEQRFELRVRDDGKGIDPKIMGHGALPGHFGLSGMRERAKEIGGKFAIWSAPGSGTELEVSVPSSMAYGTSPRARFFWLSGRFSATRP